MTKSIMDAERPMEQKTEIEGIVSAVAGECRTFNGELSRGFKIENEDVWFNIHGPDNETINKQFNPDLISKGNKVKITEDQFKPGKVLKIKLIEKSKEENNSGDDFEDFASLTNKMIKMYGHNYSIVTHCIDDIAPIENGHAFSCTLTIPTEKGERTITAHGDASKDNVTGFVQKHLLRMAETRSIVRAFRFATGSTKTAKEEISE